MPSNSYPLTLYLDTERPLGGALLLLENAQELVRVFSEQHPDRMDATLADVQDHMAAAHGKLDSTFYADQNADPNAPEET